MEVASLRNSAAGLPIRPGAIAFDLDGTLLDHSGQLFAPVAAAVRRIAAAGIKVFIVSGRVQSGSRRHWLDLGLDTPIASCNGAFVGLPGETPLLDLRLSAEALRIVLGIDREYGVHVNYYSDDIVYALHDGPFRDYYARQFCPVSLAASPEEILALPPPTKCLCITPEEEQARCMDVFSGRLGGLAALTTSNKRFLEILPPGANKGAGLRVLAEWSGVPAGKFVAVGDGMNDIPMLEAAGFAVSFDTSGPELTGRADIVLPPLWEGGMEILVQRVLGLS